MSIRERHFFYVECDGCGEQDENRPTFFEARSRGLTWLQPAGSPNMHLCEPCQDQET